MCTLFSSLNKPCIPAFKIINHQSQRESLILRCHKVIHYRRKKTGWLAAMATRTVLPLLNPFYLYVVPIDKYLYQQSSLQILQLHAILSLCIIQYINNYWIYILIMLIPNEKNYVLKKLRDLFFFLLNYVINFCTL